MADIRIDTSGLTYTQFLIPGHSPVLDGASAPTVPLEPGVYGFEQMAGQPANFQFHVTDNGIIEYDLAYEQFLSGRGTSTLSIRGFTMTLDGRALSHDLLPVVVGGSVLERDRTHELTLVPMGGYRFQPGAYVADFYFGLTTDGQIVVDQRFSEFAQASGRTLTIRGYKITIDGRQLSHDLQVYGMYGNMPIMSNTTTHELTLIPQTQNGYLLQPGAYIADFYFG
ncbi:hypothetical protein, partial [Actinomadura sp. 3N508]|uniref:hypothetical protein n=1 Tax=Actinomadura sp. 3N508 TaxID=3375153 RepID=UPI00379EF740